MIACVAGGSQVQVQCVGHIPGLVRCAEFPCNDVPAVIIEKCPQVEPTPADDLEIGEVGLPELVRPSGLVVKQIFGGQSQIGRAGDQIVGLEDAIDRSLLRKILFVSVNCTASSRGDRSLS